MRRQRSRSEFHALDQRSSLIDATGRSDLLDSGPYGRKDKRTADGRTRDCVRSHGNKVVRSAAPHKVAPGTIVQVSRNTMSRICLAFP